MSDKPTTTAAYSVAEALVRLNLSRDSFYKLVREGRLTVRKCGRRSLVLDSDLAAFLESLPRGVCAETAERMRDVRATRGAATIGGGR
jgi:excisionase family DNA binding protein